MNGLGPRILLHYRLHGANRQSVPNEVCQRCCRSRQQLQTAAPQLGAQLGQGTFRDDGLHDHVAWHNTTANNISVRGTAESVDAVVLAMAMAMALAQGSVKKVWS
jgi:hypothetical protein